MEEEKQRTRAYDATINIAILTALAYVAAYSFHRGYASHFGVPPFLMEISIQSLMIALGASVTVLLLAFVVLDMVISFWPSHWPDGAQLAVRRVVLVSFVIGVTGWLIDVSSKSWFVIATLAVIFITVSLVLPLITHRKERSYVAKLHAANQGELRRTTREGLLDLIERKTGSGIVLIAIVTIFALFACGLIGSRAARTQDEFLVLSSMSPCVVVTRAGDHLVCVGADFKDKLLNGEVYLVPMGGSQTSLQRVGPFTNLRRSRVTSELNR